MYALHGLNQDETYLIGDGNSGFRIMLGNMMNQGMAKDMIVVFPYIFASKTMDQASGFDDVSFAAYDNFINELTNDLMPYIKKTYSVAEGRNNTAIIGFSMGGRESLYIGYKLQNQIGYVGAIAPAPGLTPAQDWASNHKGMISESEFKFAQDPNVLMICCGTADSVVGSFPKSYHDILTRNGENHYWWEIQGSDHGDPAVTNGLYNFCKAIFK
jgi:glucuronoarabinoxylan endo-1,4-beta-xylanase